MRGKVAIAFLIILIFCINGVSASASSNYIYSYDANNRLKSIERDGVVIQTFEYDTNGNMIKSRSVNSKATTTITYPSGTVDAPTVMNSPGNIEWEQKSPINGDTFISYEIIVKFNGNPIFSSGTITQNTKNNNVSIPLPDQLELSALEPNKTYEVSIRVSNDSGWGDWSSPVYFTVPEDSEPSEDNILQNPGFENITSGKPDAWETIVDGNGSIVPVANPVVQGSSAIKIDVMGLNQWTSGHLKQSVPVTAGLDYTLSGYVHAQALSSTYAQLRVRFFDNNNQFIEEHFVGRDSVTSEFTLLSLYNKVPSAAATADVYVYVMASADGGSGTAYFDSLSFHYNDTQPVVDDQLLNGGFENITNELPNAWSAFIDNNAGTIAPITDPVIQGSKAMKIDVAGLNLWTSGHLKQSFSVAADRDYTLSGYVHAVALTNTYTQLRVRFFDSNDQFVDEHYVNRDTVTSEYTLLSFTNKVPAAAVKAEVYAYVIASADGGSGTAYFDSLSLQYKDSAPEGEGQLINGGFESVRDGVPHAWTAFIDNNSGTVASITSPVLEGASALKIEVTGLGLWSSGHVKQSIAVTAGRDYELSGYVHAVTLTNTYTQLRVRFFDSNNQFIDEHYVGRDTVTADYTQLSFDNKVPANAVRADVYAYVISSADGGNGIAYFDSLNFQYKIAPPVMDEQLLNNGFENVDNGLPMDWIGIVDNNAGTVSFITSPVTEGTSAVKIEVAELGIWSSGHVKQTIAVIPGSEYTLSGYVHAAALTNTYTQLRVRFYDSNNQFVDEHYVGRDTVTPDYTQLSFDNTVPVNAVRGDVYAYVIANGESGSGTAYFDSLSFKYRN
ncbi:carbohydrate binding domain-containing protein [Paenibacillus pasadenensis]|uniref:carbohydrate binding domain-containing protein n=1 Tax=Paenibacillus pasadenensis TaxID=217090 RepID=UPI00203B2D1B|nr:carbohydrate binding domain-containing protein [Paenibacillus pasadenensis]